ncbi:conserved protein of unknown function [Xenorhabdus poinarii G6]|uniref:Uncharacterized protein n=1 Tax=Xenorhabdus poinarii G6 TaxID=1354304 RepID=A0A068R3G8_9GAMM|nr:hypothetical protein [Xenorhabdus poinarii]CDG20665.1 conserved protein of unknown function [Xenorhabdus poinarii G6]
MSLETSLNKNNELLAQQKTLLEQQNALYTQNNSLIQQLLSALANNVVTQSAAPEKENTLKDEPYIQLAVEHVEQPNKTAKPAKKKAAVDKTPVDIETLDLETVVALAVLFKNDAYNLTADKLAQARAVIEGVGESERNGQADALDCALQGVLELKALTKAQSLDLCLEMLENWDNIPGITERREFALDLLNQGTRASEPEPEPEPEPELDYGAIFNQAQQALLRLAKNGYRREAVDIVAKFGVKKLGDIPQEKLPEVLAQAEAALEE